MNMRIIVNFGYKLNLSYLIYTNILERSEAFPVIKMKERNNHFLLWKPADTETSDIMLRKSYIKKFGFFFPKAGGKPLAGKLQDQFQILEGSLSRRWKVDWEHGEQEDRYIALYQVKEDGGLK